MKPSGPFNLLHQNQFFNGWPTLASDDKTILMAFPVEGWHDSAAVTLRQQDNGALDINVYGTADAVQAKQQAVAAMSLDEDGSLWRQVGERDEFIDRLQKQYQYLRPSLFHSPYEAAAAFIIGHRITIPQARKLRANMAAELGDKIVAEGESFYAFPRPGKLLELKEFKGLNETKISRLHSIAQAAQDGLLDRAHLRKLDDVAALAELESLPGIGPFFSQGILYRGAGKKDSFSHDDMTYHALKSAYNLDDDVSAEDLQDIAKNWQPYRMWAIVLMHVWLRKTNNFPRRTFNKKH